MLRNIFLISVLKIVYNIILLKFSCKASKLVLIFTYEWDRPFQLEVIHYLEG